MNRARNRLFAGVAALVLLHLLVALAPAEPTLFGAPFGLALELVVVGISTLNLWFAVRIAVARRRSRRRPVHFRQHRRTTVEPGFMTLAVVALYLAAVVGIGLGSRLGRARGPDRGGEGFFLAGRSIGPFVLLMTLFGTNMTAFTILGGSGEAYRQGIRVFALMATSSAIVIPMTFLVIGVPLWRLGKRHGFATQAEFFEERYGSPALGLLVLGASLLWLVPYVLIGVKGGGDALAAIADADVAIPAWAGSLVMCLVVLIYVVLGGMRSTALVNTFQTLVFIAVSGLAFFVITAGMGGFVPAMARLGEQSPELLELARSPRDWIQIATYLFVPLSTSCFPHIFSHWMSARSAEAFRLPVLAYPVCIAAVWFPSVVLGALGRLDVPLDATGPVIILLIREHSGSLLAGLLAAGVFAAIMSSLDSQTLAVGTMLTKNAAARVPRFAKWSESRQALLGRIFVAGFLVVVFVLSLVSTQTIFSLGVWALSGFTSFFPVLIGALYWKRSTGAGAAAGILSGLLLWTFFFVSSGGAPGWTIGGSGVEPAAAITIVSALALVVVSRLTAAAGFRPSIPLFRVDPERRSSGPPPPRENWPASRPQARNSHRQPRRWSAHRSAGLQAPPGRTGQHRAAESRNSMSMTAQMERAHVSAAGHLKGAGERARPRHAGR